MSPERIKCLICGSMILPATVQANGGLCAQCVKTPPARRSLMAAVHAEKEPLGRAIAMYSALIDSFAATSGTPNFGAITDPEFTGARFYAPETIGDLQLYNDSSAEVETKVVDEIDQYLMAVPPGYSLLRPIATKLRSISPSFNSAGKTVFLVSMGMGLDEIAWLIRFLNDRPTFERFLRGTSLTEEQLDVYNESYGRELAG